MTHTKHRYLTTRGYCILKSTLDKKQERQLIKEMTVTTTVLPAFRKFQKPKKYRLYFHDSKYYYLPRYFAERKYGKAVKVNLSHGKQIKGKCKYDPMPFQKQAATKMDEIFNPDKFPDGNGGVLCLPCGYGKTYTALRTITRLGRKALVVVNKDFLMDQWQDAVKKFTNLSCGILQQDKMEMDNDIVIAMLHSLCLRDYPEGIFDDFGIIVFDEVHHLASEMFSKALLKVRPRFTLGLSATPNRKDGLSQVFYDFIGPVIHHQKREGANRVIVKQIHIQSASNYYEVKYMANNTKNTGGMITSVSQFPQRNALLIELIKRMATTGRTTLILSSRREHLHDLKDLLDALQLIKTNGQPITYGFYYGRKGINKKEHRKLLEESAQKDIILGTSQIAQEGLDIPTLNTLIFATPPGTDVEQAVGRILRKYHKQYYPMVIDLVDCTGNFKTHARQRNKWFNEEDYDIQQLKIQMYDDPYLNQYDEQLSGFLNSKNTGKTLAIDREETKRDSGPDLNVCLVGELVKPKKVKQKISIKPKTQISIAIKAKPFGDDNCLLPFEPSSNSYIAPIDLDTNVCLLPPEPEPEPILEPTTNNGISTKGRTVFKVIFSK